MGLRYVDGEGGERPGFFCDGCGQEIVLADDGNAHYASREEDYRAGKVWFSHKRCCSQVDHEFRTASCEDLQTFFFWLIRNLKVDLSERELYTMPGCKGFMPVKTLATTKKLMKLKKGKYPIRTFAEVARNVERKQVSDQFHDGDVVYFFGNERAQAVKIGFTNNLNKRFRSIRGANCDELICLAWIPGGRDIEAAIHAHFKDHRIRGEWFHYNDVVEKAILDIRQNGWPLEAS